MKLVVKLYLPIINYVCMYKCLNKYIDRNTVYIINEATCLRFYYFFK